MGRPREFDIDEALQAAMELFWRKGYEGTSLTDLTDGMGITRPSLYGTFGNKEELFRKALERYEQGYMGFFRDAMGEPTAREVVEKMMNGYVDALTATCNPGGCMGINAAMACSDAAAEVQKAVIEKRKFGERTLCERFAKARDEGDLSPESDPADLARYIMTVSQGMAVQAVAGASRDALRKVVSMTMKAFPG
ncbi:MAG: TetR/AcrR family transcriptional regulator [Rhizobiaceae bacterium]|nr:TetR/AcrR family transcriptional regulator [Rhizobiaceae bacterium]